MPQRRANLFKRAERWLSNGYADLTLSEYHPFLTVRDVASNGRCHRIYSWTAGRLHHLFSDLEASVFYFFEYLKTAKDIREQYPLLPLEETLNIAEQLGVGHPAYNEEIHIMSTDFLITKPDGSLIAIQVKPSSKLKSKRTRQKLDIEQEYWRRKEVPYRIITEKEIPSGLVSSVKWIHMYKSADGISTNGMPTDEYVDILVSWLSNNKKLSLARACMEADEQYGLLLGTSLTVARHALAQRKLPVLIDKGIDTAKPLEWIKEEK